MQTTIPPLAITAIGMATSLGLDAGSACAAARAGLAEPSELDYELYDAKARAKVKVYGHPLGAYTKGFSELGRWVRVGALALQNLVERSGISATELAGAPFFLNLPSGYYADVLRQRRAASQTRDEAEPEGPTYADLVPWYEGVVDKTFAALDAPAPRARQVFFEDEAGVVSTLAAASAAFAEGRASACVVGGVDSLVDPYWLPICDELGILKTQARAVGFMPGEAAAFLLLEPAHWAARRGATILGTIAGPSKKREANARFADKPPRGVALAEAIVESLPSARGACSTFYCDLNGDAVRAFDWGAAQVRLRAHVAERVDVVPAMSFGSTRAASGFVAACLAARALEKGYAKSPSALVWAASDDGARASFTVNHARA